MSELTKQDLWEHLKQRSFRTIKTDDGVEEPVLLHTCEVKKVSSDSRELTIIGSDETQDRYGDIIRAAGWDLGNFKKAPRILINHDNDVRSIVGTAVKTWINKDNQLMFDVKLINPDKFPLAAYVRDLIEEGALNTVSVGFIPKKADWIYETNEDGTKSVVGVEFKEHELLELSFVAIPANPSALIQNTDKGYEVSAEESDTEEVAEDGTDTDTGKAIRDEFERLQLALAKAELQAALRASRNNSK